MRIEFDENASLDKEFKEMITDELEDKEEIIKINKGNLERQYIGRDVTSEYELEVVNNEIIIHLTDREFNGGSWFKAGLIKD